MVLNFTRYSNSLVLMSHYIAGEQNLPANLQQDNKLEKLGGDISICLAAELSSSNPTSLFKIKRKFLKINFLETKLVSSTLRTVVLKLVISDPLHQTVSPKIFFSPCLKNFRIFRRLHLILFGESSRAYMIIGPRNSHSMTYINTSVQR